MKNLNEAELKRIAQLEKRIKKEKDPTKLEKEIYYIKKYFTTNKYIWDCPNCKKENQTLTEWRLWKKDELSRIPTVKCAECGAEFDTGDVIRVKDLPAELAGQERVPERVLGYSHCRKCGAILSFPVEFVDEAMCKRCL